MPQITTTEQLSEHVAKIIATYSDKDDSASDFAVGYRLGYLAVQMLCTFRKPLPRIVELLREKSLMQMFPQRQNAESARGSVRGLYSSAEPTNRNGGRVINAA